MKSIKNSKHLIFKTEFFKAHHINNNNNQIKKKNFRTNVLKKSIDLIVQIDKKKLTNTYILTKIPFIFINNYKTNKINNLFYLMLERLFKNAFSKKKQA